MTDILTPSEDDEYDLIVDLIAMAEDIEARIEEAMKAAGATRVANQAERNALFPSPVQGDRVWRNDLGYTETYYATYDETTNPGGRTSAGWARDGWQSSILAMNRGGTGASTKSGIRTNVGITSGTAAPNNSNGDNGDIYFRILA